jgi:hypothetical protein
MIQNTVLQQGDGAIECSAWCLLRSKSQKSDFAISSAVGGNDEM